MTRLEEIRAVIAAPEHIDTLEAVRGVVADLEVTRHERDRAQAEVARLTAELASMRAAQRFKPGDRVRMDLVKFPFAKKNGPPLVIESVVMVEHVMVKVEGGDESWPDLAANLLPAAPDGGQGGGK